MTEFETLKRTFLSDVALFDKSKMDNIFSYSENFVEISGDGVARGIDIFASMISHKEITIGSNDNFKISFEFTTLDDVTYAYIDMFSIGTFRCLVDKDGITWELTPGISFVAKANIAPNHSYHCYFSRVGTAYNLYLIDRNTQELITETSTYAQDLSLGGNLLIHLNSVKFFNLKAISVLINDVSELNCIETITEAIQTTDDSYITIPCYNTTLHKKIIPLEYEELFYEIKLSEDYLLESEFDSPIQIPKRTSENTNIAPRDLRSFTLSREFISSLIPDNIRDTWTFEKAVDIIYSAITDGSELPLTQSTETGKQISKYHDDIEYYNTDIAKISKEMKLAKLHDSGFSYLADLYQDEESMSNLIVFLNLIKELKGTLRGFKLILDILGISCNVVTWLEDHDLDIFTIQLRFNIVGDTLNLTREPQNDVTIGGVHYYAWKNKQIFYTVNSDIPEYQLTDIISYYGSKFPYLDSETGILSEISFESYPYLKNTYHNDEIVIKIRTSEDDANMNVQQELFRGLDSGGNLVTSLTMVDGMLGDYVIEPDTNYYLKINVKKSFDTETKEYKYIYAYSIRTEDEMQYTNVKSEETNNYYAFSLDLCRTFKGILDLSSSFVVDENDITTYMVKDMTEERIDNRPYVNKGDEILVLNGGSSEPVGAVLSTELDKLGFTTGILGSFAISSSGSLDTDTSKAILKLARSYLAPLVTIETDVTQEIIISNTYFSAGLINSITCATKEITQSL